MPRRLTAAALAVASMVLLSSCLDYDEELTIHDNLSGVAYVTLTLPDTLITKYERIGIELDRAKVEKRLESASGVSLISYENSGGRQPKIRMAFKFSSLDKLNAAIAANPPAAIWAGQFTITNDSGQTKVDRKLGVGNPREDTPPYNNAFYKTHYDGAITATNSPQYNSPAKDVRFHYKLSDMLAQQPTQSTTFVKGWPWMLILICLAIIGGAAWYGWEYFGKKRPVNPLYTPSPPRPPAGAAPESREAPPSDPPGPPQT